MSATHCTQRGEPSMENQTPESSIIGQVRRFNRPPTTSSLANAGRDREAERDHRQRPDDRDKEEEGDAAGAMEVDDGADPDVEDAS